MMSGVGGRPGQPLNPTQQQQQQQQQPYGPYSQTGPTQNLPGQGGMMQSGQQQHGMMGQQTQPGMQQQQQQPGMQPMMPGMQQNRMGQPNQMGGVLNPMNPQQQQQNPMGAPNQMGQMVPRPGGPQPQPRAINQQQQAQLQQKKPRYFMAMFDYDPTTMSPNPDGCEEELAFQEGDTIKVGISPYYFYPSKIPHIFLKKKTNKHKIIV